MLTDFKVFNVVFLLLTFLCVKYLFFNVIVSPVIIVLGFNIAVVA